MTIQHTVRNTLSSLVFVLAPAILFMQRFLEAAICGISIFFIVVATLLICSCIPGLHMRLTTVLARCIVAVFFVSLVLLLFAAVMPMLVRRFTLLLPILAINIMLLSQSQQYVRKQGNVLMLPRHIVVFSFIYAVGIMVLGMVQELLIFHEISLSIMQDTQKEIADNPFRLIMFTSGGLILLGYIQGGIHYLEQRKRR